MAAPDISERSSTLTGIAATAGGEREARALRPIFVAGGLLSLAVAGAYLFAPGLAYGPVISQRVAGLCIVLALVFAALVWVLPRIGAGRAVAWSLVGTAFTAAAIAAVTGQGTAALVLNFVPVMVVGAATATGSRLAYLLAAGDALLLVGLTVAEAAGAISPGLHMQHWSIRLALHLGLLGAALVIGLVMARIVSQSMHRLKRREHRFLGLLQVATDWYWETDAQFRFTHISEQAPGRSGLEAQRRLGRRPWEIEDFGLDADAMDAHRADLESHAPFSDLLVHRRGATGAWHWFAVSGQPRFDERGVFIGYWGVGRDVTVEREAELARAATEARYRELFARSPSALVLHREGRVLVANEAALRLFGLHDSSKFVGQSVFEYYDEGDGSRDRVQARVAQLGTMPVGDSLPAQPFTLRNALGRRMSVQVTSVRVQAAGGPANLTIYIDETDRLQSEAARQRSEALLSQVVATSPEMITVNDLVTGRYVMVNDAFCAQSGYARKEAIGRTPEELGLWEVDESRRRFVDDIVASGGLRDRMATLRRRDGASVMLRISAARFEMEGRDYVVSNSRDVTQTERERMERDAILENASIGIALTRERRFQLANPKFEQMFGWPSGGLVGQPGDVTSVDSSAYEALGREVGPRLARGEAVEFERTMKRRDGSTFLCRLLARPIDPIHPSKGATIWIAEDVTEKRAVQEALARARDEAEAANRAKSAFLANTSHEIRTPLNGLVGLARLARQPDLDESRRAQYLAQIDDSAQALSGVISDILDLSKIEAGKLRLERSEFDLRALLESIEHGYAALAQARSLVLSMEIADDVPRRVRGDPVRLRQVLSNFLSNALKFIEVGYVRLWVCTAGPQCIRFEVEDSGPGIAHDVQTRLFEPFTQADASTTRRYGGTGLGLSICRQLAQLMGGSVGLSSAPGQGSRFWAELPLVAVKESSADSVFGELPRESAALAGLKLLIVEDNPVNMMIAVALLQQWGVEATEAGNGIEATRLINERADAGRPFDIVLMDVQMPVQGGYEATRVLRQRFAADTLPIIALTAAALTSERDEALAAGMNDFLTKPIDAHRLRETLLRWARTVSA